MNWLPEPPDGTSICLGFDGSESSDWTGIKAETFDGMLFTPRYGPSNLPTYWDPARTGDQIPRSEVRAAVDELFERFDVARMYCDPPDWRSEIGEWATVYGADTVFEWPTYRPKQMHEELERFRTDLATGRLTHDGCPVTGTHVQNAIMRAQTNQRYVLGKPQGAHHQKIDLAMCSVLAHTAASDARIDGWGAAPTGARISYAVYGFN